MRKIKRIVIHCTDSDDSLDIGYEEINDWHKRRGWLSPSGVSCGYHYIVRRDGTTEVGRPLEETGAHVRGFNGDSIGIVWVGRKDPDDDQFRALKQIVRALMYKYEVDIDKIQGHYELDSNKTCPNLDMVKFRAELLFK
jgi:N-acetylmuramoyl-L-alanine amidase